jgi:hypothetical protein
MVSIVTGGSAQVDNVTIEYDENNQISIIDAGVTDVQLSETTKATGTVWFPLIVDLGTVTAGTWGTTTNCTNYVYGQALNNNAAAALNDEIDFDVYLDEGTYTVTIIVVKSSNFGILTYTIGGVSIVALDQYSGSQVNNFKSVTTGVNITSSGKKTLNIKVTGKNGSSSAYASNTIAVLFTKTGVST